MAKTACTSSGGGFAFDFSVPNRIKAFSHDVTSITAFHSSNWRLYTRFNGQNSTMISQQFPETVSPLFERVERVGAAHNMFDFLDKPKLHPLLISAKTQFQQTTNVLSQDG